MNPDDFARMKSALDRMIREKEITAAFFARAAECLDDVDQRGWFRRMAQDEKDQRKILIKHRRELCGRAATENAAVPVSAIHQLLARTQVEGHQYHESLKLALRGAEIARDYCNQASRHIRDRSCRIFLKILCEESLKHTKRLLVEVRRVEREAAPTPDEIAV